MSEGLLLSKSALILESTSSIVQAGDSLLEKDALYFEELCFLLLCAPPHPTGTNTHHY